MKEKQSGGKNKFIKDKYQFDLEKHLHSLGERPLTGTSSVGSLLAKPLTWWASGMAGGKFGWLNPKKAGDDEMMITCLTRFLDIKELDNDECLNLRDETYRAHNKRKNEAAEEGINLHAELEKYVKSQMGIMQEMSLELLPRLQSFMVWAKVNVKRFLYSEAHCYSERLWVGGITDAGAEMNDGRIAVIDFKSSREAYPNQFVQAAGYALQIDENGLFDASGKRIKIDRK